MNLTAKGRYAVTAILDMAVRNQITPVTLVSIATEHNISIRYLEQIFSELRIAGLVQAFKGPGGGYKLAKRLDEISIKDIMDAVGEKLEMTKCGDNIEKRCLPKEVKCSTHNLWYELGNRINKYLRSVSVGDLLSMQ